MARGVNKVILIGNLGKDLETRYFPNGDAVANATIATSESWTDKASGEKKEHTEWHNVVFRRKLAEIAAQYLKKGSKVYVEGSLRTRKWQDKDTGKDRFTTEIIVNDMQMLDGRPGGGTGSMDDGGSRSSGGGYSGSRGGSSSRPQSSAPPAQSAPDHGFEDDDIPF